MVRAVPVPLDIHQPAFARVEHDHRRKGRSAPGIAGKFRRSQGSESAGDVMRSARAAIQVKARHDKMPAISRACAASPPALTAHMYIDCRDNK
jgi:hypothetical protein